MIIAHNRQCSKADVIMKRARYEFFENLRENRINGCFTDERMTFFSANTKKKGK